jgi:hypothetical protein
MSKCERQTCLFVTRTDSERYCCKGCKRNGVHGPICEGISFKSSPDNMVAAEFDLLSCKAAYLADFSISLQIAWNSVPNATCYKLIRGGQSPIVMNSFYNNTYIDHTGCFESNSDAHMTKNIKEYLTINTNHSFIFPQASFTAPNPIRKYLTFLVYPYFGNLRGPVPTKVLCVDIFPTPSVSSSYTILAQLRPNISVSLTPDRFSVPERSRHRLYQYYNALTKQKTVRQLTWRGPTTPAGPFTFHLANNSIQSNNALATRTLFVGIGGSEVQSDSATDGTAVILYGLQSQMAVTADDDVVSE